MIRKTLLVLTAAAIAMATPAMAQLSVSAAPIGTFQLAQNNPCWYAVLGAFRDGGTAQARATAIGTGQVIENSAYSGLRNGWYSVVLGPFNSSGEAEAALQGLGGKVPGAYVAKAC